MNDPHQTSAEAPPKRELVKSILVAVVGVVCAVYLLNPGAGLVDIIPDFIPGVGNLDEATATALLLSSIAYFGWDFRRLFGRRGQTIDEDRRTINHRGPAHGG